MRKPNKCKNLSHVNRAHSTKYRWPDDKLPWHTTLSGTALLRPPRRQPAAAFLTDVKEIIQSFEDKSSLFLK